MAVSKTASTDPWPTQTDEDIDRLVALHKVNYILESLIVRKCLLQDNGEIFETQKLI